MITDKQMPRQEMDSAAIDHVCGVCGEGLSVAWGGSLGHNGYVLRCVKDASHGTFTRHNRAEEKVIEQRRTMDSKSLMQMPESKMIERVNMARFPQQLTPGDKKLLAQVAITYGFDPLMGEVSIYQGRPFVSIDGRYRKAQESGLLDGVESRPATQQERTDWKIPADDYFFRSEVYLKGSSRPCVGWGRVFGPETQVRQGKPGDAYKPTVTNPQRMAEKRAEAQALRKAFHIPLPSIEDIGGPQDNGAALDGECVTIDEETGEVLDGQGQPADTAPHIETPAASSVPADERPLTAAEEWDAMQRTKNPSPSLKINMDWLHESLKLLKWTEAATISFIGARYKVSGATLADCLGKLTPQYQEDFTKQIEKRIKGK